MKNFQHRVLGVIAAAFSLAAGLARSVGNNSSVKNTHNSATNKLVAQQAHHSRPGSEVNKLAYMHVVLNNLGNYARFQIANLGYTLQSIMAPAGGNQLALAGSASVGFCTVKTLRTAHGMVTSTSSGSTAMNIVGAGTMPNSKHGINCV